MLDPIGRAALKKASWRILPLLFLGYGIAYVDRVNIGFAALQMNQALHFTATVYGLGGGLFFLSYALCEIPSNLLLLRVRARRWIARIMLTWGVISAAMMFVKTPTQFYTMRFLLGMAEAGFFPGVLYYLTLWFPSAYRGHAVGRFYVASPLSAAVMGALAGPLLSLDGHLGLAGWQWLFLVEGIPAIVLGALILMRLPDDPGQATWLTPQERLWIQRELADEAATHVLAERPGWRGVLPDRALWLLAMANLFIFGANYAFNLSGPTVLKEIGHWSAAQVGLIVSGTALASAASMALNGMHSDRRRERYLHTIVPLSLVAVAFTLLGTATTLWLVLPAYIVFYTAHAAAQGTFWLIPSDSLHGRSAAVGLATVGSIGMLGAFVGPFAWGVLKDRTGSYQVGLLSFAVSYAGAAALLLVQRRVACSTVTSATSSLART